MFKLLLITVSILTLSPAFADERPPLSIWLKELKQEALQQNISPKTVARTFKNAKFLPRVIELDRAQPEFVSPFLTYLENRVTPTNIEMGREKLKEHEELLMKMESQYGVPKEVLVAFWGMETHYGEIQGDFGLPSALMTLAYDGRIFFALSCLMQCVQLMRVIAASQNCVALGLVRWDICSLCHLLLCNMA
jgi:membrane-bound lytic murein transglycosylase B